MDERGLGDDIDGSESQPVRQPLVGEKRIPQVLGGDDVDKQACQLQTTVLDRLPQQHERYGARQRHAAGQNVSPLPLTGVGLDESHHAERGGSVGRPDVPGGILRVVREADHLRVLAHRTHEP